MKIPQKTTPKRSFTLKKRLGIFNFINQCFLIVKKVIQNYGTIVISIVIIGVVQFKQQQLKLIIMNNLLRNRWLILN